ncbi:MAG: hypothetical protein M1831_002819 [Alyxoria varia]|nr:MAG: hypothetical protein M1831_002819 [Alyxoria varia]
MAPNKLVAYEQSDDGSEHQQVFKGRNNETDGAGDASQPKAAAEGGKATKPEEAKIEPDVPHPDKYKELIESEAKRLPKIDIETWGSSARKYAWDEEYGDIAPRDVELEEELFKNTTRPEIGDHMDTLKTFKVDTEGNHELPPVYEFSDLNLHPTMKENLELAKYKYPTPIQCWTIPAVNQGKDVVSIAQTGSGKTGAYLIPVVSKLMGKADKLCKPKPNPHNFDPKADAIQSEPLVLILCPTRELAIQIFEEARRMTYRSKLRPSVVYGGAPRGTQLADLQMGCDVLIGTPGRLRDILENFPRCLSLRRLKYTIIDEADELMGSNSFSDALTYILETAATNMNDDHQYMMFSATFAKDIRDTVAKYLTDDHIKIKVGRIGSTHSNIHQVVTWVDETRKDEALLSLLKSLKPARVLIFANTQHQVDRIDRLLYDHKQPCTAMSSSMSQRDRETSLTLFKNGQLPIMTTTSVAGRGLDVGKIMHIINYDLPSKMHGGIDEYIHRIGRTARIGNMGQATSFFNERNDDIAPDLAKVMLEASHLLPESLKQYAPEDGVLRWDEDAEEEGGSTGDLPGSGSGGGWAADPNEGMGQGGWANATDTASNNGAWGNDGTNDNSADGAAVQPVSSW